MHNLRDFAIRLTTVIFITIAVLMLVMACAEVEKVRDIAYDKAWDVGVDYCGASEERRQSYRQTVADEFSERARQEPAGTRVPKRVVVECEEN